MYNKQQRKVLAIYNKAHDVLCNFLEITIWFFWIRAQFTAASNSDLVAQQNKEDKNRRFQKIEETNYTVNILVTLGYFFTFRCKAYIIE